MFKTLTCDVSHDSETYIIGGRAEDLHQDVLVSARSFHRLAQLLHSEHVWWIQHGKDGVLEVPRQLAFQHVHQLLHKHITKDRDTPLYTPQILSVLPATLLYMFLGSSYCCYK